MRWKGRQQSDNIEDRRNQSAAGLGAGSAGSAGILRLVPLLLRTLGVKGTLLAVAALAAFSYFAGGDLSGPAGGADTARAGNAPPGAASASPAEQEMVEFVGVVLAETETTWQRLFAAQNLRYAEPRLVLYRGATRSACGLGQAAMGPFYCPADQKVYLDLSFFDDLARRHGAPGDFAQAYVIAHEVGHHVQTLLGISERVHRARQGLDEVAANALSVRQELQADCYAGLWGQDADRRADLLESGDVEEALLAAGAIGDDRLQQQGRGYVTPDSFTHGSSAQRVRWFRRGMTQGTLEACDTFAADTL
jgi:predicted metalloprotease